MPDPIRKHFGYGQLWSIQPASGQNRAESYIYAGSDFLRLIRPFGSSKEGLDRTVQNRPGSGALTMNRA